MQKFIGALVALSFAFLFAVPALAGLRQDVDNALEMGADVHFDRQGTYSVGMTGYCGEADFTWEWVIDSDVTCKNVLGISATGLVAAYDRLENSIYLDAAVLSAGELIDRYESSPERPFAQDIEFLVMVSTRTGDMSYLDSAGDYYERVTSEFTAEENVQRHFDAGRGGLSGWDIAAHIRAAATSGHWSYAYDMAAYLIDNRSDWENQPCCGGYDYTTHSHGSLLWALAVLGTNDFDDYADEIRSGLIDSQSGDGSWAGGDYQATAYVLMGLNSHSPRPRTTVNDGMAYLVDTQVDGGWPYSGTEYGEVNSEALMALGWVQVDNGQRRGWDDPQPDRGNDLNGHNPTPMN